VLGQGIAIYTNEFRDTLPPGRLPKIDSRNAYATINGGRKYRPMFVAMMSTAVGMPPFTDPKAYATDTDMFGEAGDTQNYSSSLYYCPSTPEWTDERNGSYGYNYQFLGNSRLVNSSDPASYKHWPVPASWIRHPGRTIAVGDCLGTAASFAPSARQPYLNNGKDAQRVGCEGFNLDPPRVDPTNGEMADAPEHRTAIDARHRGRGNVLRVDGHADTQTLVQFGYKLNPDGSIALDGNNAQWSGNGLDVPWTLAFTP